MARLVLDRLQRVDVQRAHWERPLRPGARLTVHVGRGRGRTEIPLELAWAPCNLGGLRPYLPCPLCGHRRVALFVWKTHLGCRRCFRLAYRSQHQDKATRLGQRAEAIERRLGWDGEAVGSPGTELEFAL